MYGNFVSKDRYAGLEIDIYFGKIETVKILIDIWKIEKDRTSRTAGI